MLCEFVNFSWEDSHGNAQLLKFEDSVLKELPVGSKEVSIGRSPENAMVIDNPAVSHYHARVFHEENRLMLEDFGSMNGTFVNGQRVKIVSLRPGGFGRNQQAHDPRVSESHERDKAGSESDSARPSAPKINETVMLDTKARREFMQQVAAVGESSQVAPERLKVPTLVVRKGKTNQREYVLNDKLTVVGKSALATVKLQGWFAPKAAAQINRRAISPITWSAADKLPRVNGQLIAHPTKLSSGDVIEGAGIEIQVCPIGTREGSLSR